MHVACTLEHMSLFVPLYVCAGSMVNERVGAGNWENGDELADTWVSRNAFR